MTVLGWVVALAAAADGVASAGDAAVGPVTPAAPAVVPDWAVLPGQCPPDDPDYDLELMYHQGRFKDGLAACDARLKAAPTSDLYWLKARFMYEIGETFQRTDTSIDKVAWYQSMLDAAEAGLKLAPDDPHLHFARGVAMGRLGTTRGVLSSLFMAKDVESDWLLVANHPTWTYASLGGNEVLPCDAFHALGIYYRLVPDWWIIQMIAGTRGDLDQSEAWNLRSTQCKPDEVENWKELGATRLCMGQKRNDPARVAEGVKSLNHGLTVTAVTPRQKLDRSHIQMLIADPSLACEYSRDGQQDLDEKKLDAKAE
ncbi:MAG: hypothetical protein ABMB14_31590 [Myxococcota bacterium]